MVHAIILAGGSGSRLKASPLPKQFIEIEGRTLLERVCATFARHPSIDDLTVVVPGDQMDLSSHALRNLTAIPLTIIPGGATRQASARLGVNKVMERASDHDIILIHDAARVLIDPAIINRAIESMDKADAATAALPAKDTLMTINASRIIDGKIDRSHVINVQTPQAFRARVILEAHEKATACDASDDISIVMGSRQPIYFLGSALNFKVTTDDDLRLLQAVIKGKADG